MVSRFEAVIRDRSVSEVSGGSRSEACLFVARRVMVSAEARAARHRAETSTARRGQLRTYVVHRVSVVERLGHLLEPTVSVTGSPGSVTGPMGGQTGHR